jgi:hypothetical protein
MCVYVYIYICIHIYTYAYTYIHMHTYIHIHYTCAYTHIYNIYIIYIQREREREREREIVSIWVQRSESQESQWCKVSVQGQKKTSIPAQEIRVQERINCLYICSVQALIRLNNVYRYGVHVLTELLLQFCPHWKRWRGLSEVIGLWELYHLWMD